MCDSGISLNSSMSADDRYLSDESEFNQNDFTNHDEIDIVCAHPNIRGKVQANLNVTPKLNKSAVTMSNYNISAQYASPSMSRTSSTLSLAASSYRSSSPVTVLEVRTLTNNFQKMLAQATQEIKKLNIQKTNLEKEQEKLLTVNIELAMEAKKLVTDVKEGKEEKKGLLAANEEFAEEVKRLYREEEMWEEETFKLQTETADISERLGRELKSVQEDWEEEKIKHKIQEEKLVESVRVLTFDNDKLLQEREKEKLISSKSHLELKADYDDQITKLNASISCLRNDLEREQVLKDEGEKQVEDLAQQFEKAENEMEKMQEDHEFNKKKLKEKMEAKINLLENKSEKLAAENFEYAVENEELNTKLKTSIEAQKKVEREITQMKVEHQWLISNKKKTSGTEGKIEDLARELQQLKRELREEKEKVKNLSEWKTQLAEKNKGLKEENNRLLKKTEDLEHLMNDELTDINEMMKVINKLQVN